MVMSALHCVQTKLPCWHCGNVGVALRANKAALLALCAPMVMLALHCVQTKLPCWHCVPRWS